MAVMDQSAPLREVYYRQDYESDFEPDPVIEDEKSKRRDLATKEPPKCVPKPPKQVFTEECSKEQARIQRFHDLPLDAYTRHKLLINEYVLCYKGATAKLRRDTSKDKTYHDVIKENHRFLWDEDEDTGTWEKQLAKKYYDKLFKEYCITDLSRFKEKKVAMRWRTEKEVIEGKGQFFCGSVHCSEKEGLRSWEVNFGYVEQGVKKNALVKLRLCPDCTYKLNFCRKCKEVLPHKMGVPSNEQPKKKLKTSAASEISSDLATEKTLCQTSGAAKDAANSEQVSELDIWKQPVKRNDGISKEDDFQDYLADMLL